MILDQAQTLCQLRGFNAFSYRDLAQLLGIKSASIHYHYPTKSDLGVALIVRYRGAFNAELSKIRSEIQNPTKQLRKFISIIEQIKREKKLCLCAMLASDFETLTPEMRAQVREFFAEAEKWVTECLIAGKREGEFSFSKSPEAIARIFMATVQGMLICARAFDEDNRFEDGREWLLSAIAA